MSSPAQAEVLSDTSTKVQVLWEILNYGRENADISAQFNLLTYRITDDSKQPSLRLLLHKNSNV